MRWCLLLVLAAMLVATSAPAAPSARQDVLPPFDPKAPAVEPETAPQPSIRIPLRDPEPTTRAASQPDADISRQAQSSRDRIDLRDLVTSPDSNITIPDIAPARADPSISRTVGNDSAESTGLSPLEIGLAVLALVGATIAGIVAWRRRA